MITDLSIVSRSVISKLIDDRGYCLIPKHLPFKFKKVLFELHLNNMIRVTNDVMYPYNYVVVKLV